MPKVNVPSGGKFIKKLFFAILILIILVLIGTAFLNPGQGYDYSFEKTMEIIAHVQVDGTNNSLLFISLSLIGYATQIYILYLILEFVLEGKFRNIFTEVKTLNTIKRMKNHYIVCGGGRVGQHVADELIRNKKPYVILEAHELTYKKLKKKHYNILNADTLDEKELEKANIANAAWLIACLGDDGDNILLTLTAKELNSSLRIAARANNESIVNKLRHAGAEHVVLPEILGGIRLAEAAIPGYNEKGMGTSAGNYPLREPQGNVLG